MRRPLLPAVILKRLQRGLAIGARAHDGLAATWAWVVDYLFRACEFFVTTINGSTGDVTIGGGGGISVSTDGSTITISGSGGTGGNVTIVGTDGSTASGNTISFASASDSNVIVRATQSGSNSITVTFGVYYR